MVGGAMAPLCHNLLPPMYIMISICYVICILDHLPLDIYEQKIYLRKNSTHKSMNCTLECNLFT